MSDYQTKSNIAIGRGTLIICVIYPDYIILAADSRAFITDVSGTSIVEFNNKILNATDDIFFASAGVDRFENNAKMNSVTSIVQRTYNVSLSILDNAGIIKDEMKKELLAFYNAIPLQERLAILANQTRPESTQVFIVGYENRQPILANIKMTVEYDAHNYSINDDDALIIKDYGIRLIGSYQHIAPYIRSDINYKINDVVDLISREAASNPHVNSNVNYVVIKPTSSERGQNY